MRHPIPGGRIIKCIAEFLSDVKKAKTASDDGLQG
jgi:hypothetical protein